MLDCAVIGGGPAGLNASLVLGRSRRATVLFDNEQPRNAVTQEAHGFMTRDGINPGELRRLAREELGKYPDVHIKKQKVTRVWKHDGIFSMETEEGDLYTAKKVIVATGLKERLPEIPHIHQFYGTSLFSCPFCDGWELRDRPLAVIAENSGAFHMTKVVYNWSRDLVVCTNGKQTLSGDELIIAAAEGSKAAIGVNAALVEENF